MAIYSKVPYNDRASYEKNFAPVLENVKDKCKKAGIPFFSVVIVSDNGKEIGYEIVSNDENVEKEFCATKALAKELSSSLAEIKLRASTDLKLPFFACFGLNDGKTTNYVYQISSPYTHDFKTTKDFFPQLYMAMRGFKTTMPMDDLVGSNLEFLANNILPQLHAAVLGGRFEVSVKVPEVDFGDLTDDGDFVEAGGLENDPI